MPLGLGFHAPSLLPLAFVVARWHLSEELQEPPPSTLAIAPLPPVQYPLDTYAEELQELTSLGREAIVARLRRGSAGFTRGSSKYRGVTRHHSGNRWEVIQGRGWAGVGGGGAERVRPDAAATAATAGS